MRMWVQCGCLRGGHDESACRGALLLVKGIKGSHQEPAICPTSRVPASVPLQYHTSAVTGICFAPRSMLLATAARDGTVALWPLFQPDQ
jgi:WD40 repeat protein